jgi:hypothetical protein
VCRVQRSFLAPRVEHVCQSMAEPLLVHRHARSWTRAKVVPSVHKGGQSCCREQLGGRTADCLGWRHVWHGEREGRGLHGLNGLHGSHHGVSGAQDYCRRRQRQRRIRDPHVAYQMLWRCKHAHGGTVTALIRNRLSTAATD